jgi:hypothetical protein
MPPGRRVSLTIALVIASLLLAGCVRRSATVQPVVVFTKLPPFETEGSEKLDAIEGRVTGAHPGQRIVLYARSGEWWIQPFADRPFTTIQADSSWKASTHPGTAYAAVLVDSSFRPTPKTDVLPEKGGPILAINSVQSLGPQPPPRSDLLFAGYEWQSRRSTAVLGGARNQLESANAWADSAGLLHLKISGSQEHWNSAEVALPRSLGYGSYRFVVQDLSHLEPAVLFKMTIRDDTGPAREMDIEISKWGETTDRNGQFVVQPYHVPANTVQFETPPGNATFMLRWAPERASFKAFRGVTSSWDARAIRQHVFTSGVPSAGSEYVRMGLFVFGQNRNPLKKESEVVIEAFEYLP